MQPVFFIRPEVRSVPSDEGTVLLDLRSGKYFALNSTASLVWRRLEAGADRGEIERVLRERFGAGEEVGKDLETLLAGLERRGLIEREDNVETPRGASPDREERSRQVESPAARPGFRKDLAASETPHGASLHWIAAGLAALVFTDLTLALLGFSRCSRLLARTGSRGPADAGRIARICAAVDGAARFYFKRAWCLQRSLAAVLLLRLAGQPADLVIGVRRFPFLAHAWVEVGGRVVNDDPRVKPTFPEMARC